MLFYYFNFREQIVKERDLIFVRKRIKNFKAILRSFVQKFTVLDSVLWHLTVILLSHCDPVYQISLKNRVTAGILAILIDAINSYS